MLLQKGEPFLPFLAAAAQRQRLKKGELVAHARLSGWCPSARLGRRRGQRLPHDRLFRRLVLQHQLLQRDVALLALQRRLGGRDRRLGRRPELGRAGRLRFRGRLQLGHGLGLRHDIRLRLGPAFHQVDDLLQARDLGARALELALFLLQRRHELALDVSPLRFVLVFADAVSQPGFVQRLRALRTLRVQLDDALLDLAQLAVNRVGVRLQLAQHAVEALLVVGAHPFVRRR